MPAQPPPQAWVGNTGPIYGTQSSHVWAAGQVDPRQVIDSLKSHSLWRFSVFGNVALQILYGTQATQQINALAPCVFFLPGQVVVLATPRNAEGTTCHVTLTPVWGQNRSHCRALLDATGGALAFSPDAVRFVALVASTLTVAGIAVAVPALAECPLVTGSVLNTGTGFQEFEA
jgi:hypothetical protein